jgi:hypothetical protein
MTGDEWTSYVGKLEEAPDLQHVLKTLGVTRRLRLPKGDTEIRADRPELGLSLIFGPEGPKSSRLRLEAVQFLSDREESYSTFAQPLPRSLSFSDGSKEARAKLGEPFRSIPRIRHEIWRIGELQLGIDYAKEPPHTIGVVTIQIPPTDE